MLLMALTPAVALLTLAAVDTMTVLAYYEGLEAWSYACSEGAIGTLAHNPRHRALRELEPGQERTWRLRIDTPYGALQSTLRVVNTAPVAVRSTCVRAGVPAIATTYVNLWVRDDDILVVPGTWMQCGVRTPCS